MIMLRENLKRMTAGEESLFEKDIVSTEEEKEKVERRGRNGGGGVDVRGYLPVVHPDQIKCLPVHSAATQREVRAKL